MVKVGMNWDSHLEKMVQFLKVNINILVWLVVNISWINLDSLSQIAFRILRQTNHLRKKIWWRKEEAINMGLKLWKVDLICEI